MNRRQKKSSRLRMDSRIKRKVGQSPAQVGRIDEETQKVFYRGNRALRALLRAKKRDADSKDARQENNNKRKKNLVAARRAISAMKKETRKFMRQAGLS